MAVRFDAVTDRLVRTSDILNYNAAYSIMGWFRIVVDTDSYAYLISLNNGTDNNEHEDTLSSDIDGTSINVSVFNSWVYTYSTSSTFTVGTWYHAAMVRTDASNLSLYVNGVLIGTATRSVTGRAAATRLEVGGYSTSNLWPMNGRVHSIKAWSAALSLAEIQAEMQCVRPVRTLDLHGFWPCFAGTERTDDLSGAGRDFTASGTLTDEDPPPVSWGAGVDLYPYAASGAAVVTGDAALSGAGALDGTGLQIAVGAAAPAGAGTLTGAALLIAIGAATLAGTGTLEGTAVGGATVTGAADMPGVGALAGTGLLIAIGASALAGVGALSAAGEDIVPAAGTLAGSGTLAGAGSVLGYAAATIAGTGTLAASGSGIACGAAVLAGTGILFAVAVGTIAPILRTYTILSDGRTYIIRSESRTILEQREPRTQIIY